MRVYPLIALLAFAVVTAGSDLFARTTIAGESLSHAIAGYLHWTWPKIAGLALLFSPFAGTAVICGYASRHAKTRSVATIFGISIALLSYFYFNNFQFSQQALLEERWTAAALSIGLLPYIIGIPLLVGVAIAAAVAARFDRRSSFSPK